MLRYSWNVHYEFGKWFVSVGMWPETSWSKFYNTTGVRRRPHSVKTKPDAFPIKTFLVKCNFH